MAAATIPYSPAIAIRPSANSTMFQPTRYVSFNPSRHLGKPQLSTCFRASKLVVRCSIEPQPVLQEEKIYDPGRKQFISKEELGSSFKGINRILLIGPGSQVHAGAMKLDKSLSGLGISVMVCSGNDHIFNDDSRRSVFTIGGVKETISSSDLILLFTEDANQAADYKEIFSHMKPGSIIGLSNGYLVSHLRSQGVGLRKDISVISVFHGQTKPLKQQGDFNDANAKTEFVAYRDLDGRAKNVFAHAWALGVGSLICASTQEQEYGESGTSLSDLKRLGQGYVEQIKQKLYMDKLLNGDVSSVGVQAGVWVLRNTTSTAKVEGTRDADSNLLKEGSQDWNRDPFHPVTRNLLCRTGICLFGTLNRWLSFLIITSSVYLVYYALSRLSPSPDISSTQTWLSAGLSRDGATLGAAHSATSISLTNLPKAVYLIVPVLGLVALYIVYR